MMDKTKLVGRKVYYRIAAMPHALGGNVANVESDGLWIEGSQFANELTTSGLSLDLKSPIVFVPFSSLAWILTEKD